MTGGEFNEGVESGVPRREFLRRAGLGVGWLGLSQLMAETVSAPNPLQPRPPHIRPAAKRVIHFFLNGGASHVDSFDPKPMLERYAGKPLPTENLRTERKTGAAFPSPFKFSRHGASGLDVSELFPYLARHADDLAVIRSMQADVPNHEPSLMLMNCGDAVQSRPSFGSWVTYGLGTENQNLPAFIAMCPGGYPIKEAENWQSGFLPGVFQGTFIDPKHTEVEKLIEHVRNHYVTAEAQRRQLDLLQYFNREHQRRGRASNARLEARIHSFELAYRMQAEAMDAFDLSRESKAARELYGDTVHGRQTLMARRLLERGVRVVQLWHGAGQPWDSHDKIEDAHRRLARDIDRPIAALIHDLKTLGLFEDTLILVGGEFGRTPTVELKPSGDQTYGRDHNPYGFSVALAGGGIRGGTVCGATDEFGFKAVDNVVHVHDLHATLLHCLGFDHERFTYRYAGRDFRLTDVHGRVVPEVLNERLV